MNKQGNLVLMRDFSNDLGKPIEKTENKSKNFFMKLDTYSTKFVKGSANSVSHQRTTNSEEAQDMQETYSKNEIDLKFDNLSDKVDNKFDLLSQKIDNGFSNQTLQLNNYLLEFKQALKDESEKERKEREQAKKESVRWYIGIVFTTIGTGIAIAGTIAAFLV